MAAESNKAAATITPKRDADACGTHGCDAEALLALVEPDDVAERRVLCPTHRVEYLREVANR